MTSQMFRLTNKNLNKYSLIYMYVDAHTRGPDYLQPCGKDTCMPIFGCMHLHKL